MEQRKVNPWDWQNQFAFSQAIEVAGGSRALYCAGQTSVDEQGHPLHVGDMRKQVEMAFQNLEIVLKTAGFTSLMSYAQLLHNGCGQILRIARRRDKPPVQSGFSTIRYVVGRHETGVSRTLDRDRGHRREVTSRDYCRSLKGYSRCAPHPTGTGCLAMPYSGGQRSPGKC